MADNKIRKLCCLYCLSPSGTRSSGKGSSYRVIEDDHTGLHRCLDCNRELPYYNDEHFHWIEFKIPMSTTVEYLKRKFEPKKEKSIIKKTLRQKQRMSQSEKRKKLLEKTQGVYQIPYNSELEKKVEDLKELFDIKTNSKMFEKSLNYLHSKLFEKK